MRVFSILFLLTVFSGSAFANDDQCCSKENLIMVCCTPEPKIQPKPEPKVIYKTRWKTKVVEKKVDRPVPYPVRVKEKCCEKKPNNTNTNTVHRSRTGNQKVIVNVPRQRDRVIKIIKHRTKIKEKRVKVEVTNPNRIQLLLGRSKTEQAVERLNCCDIEATREYETDVGVQYLRDFGNFTGSITGTSNESYYLGVGLNW